jgi:phage terminase large subunit GpA-like protein
VSQWAEENRILPETSAAQGARWRNSTAPYLAGIMDVMLEPSVRRVGLMKCTQSGGSEAVNNIIGYCMQHRPRPMLMVHPTVEVAQAFSKERLSDMIRTTPALRAVVKTRRVQGDDHRAESTLDIKTFPGGFLALGGANTPNTFARWSVRLAIGDDVDRFPAVVGDEGDPAELLAKRTTTFHDKLTFCVSTPILKGGRIDAMYARSDQRRFHVKCPRCGRVDYVTWSDPDHFHVVFDNRDPATARIECPNEEHHGCGYRVYEMERAELIASGIWLATAEAKESGLAGFHVPGMLSPWITLPELVSGFLDTRTRGREAFKTWINTMLGEAWDDRTSKVEGIALHARIEDYGELEDGSPIEVPQPAVCLTAGVDVQKDGFFLLVCGWGPAEERWVVDWRTVPGDPDRADSWAALLESLARRYQHASGHLLPILATCIDSGYATSKVYDFVRANQVRRIFATKGVAGKSGERLICRVSPPTSTRVVGKTQRAAARHASRPVTLYNVNVDDAKAGLIGDFNLPAPGPKYVHFPSRVDTIDSEFFAQLCAEHAETRYNKGGIAVSTIWVQDREANHALDAMILCQAASILLGQNVRDLAERLASAPVSRPEGSIAPQPAKVALGENPSAPRVPVALPPRPKPRRFSVSSYLTR